jgi:hypothetical protein
VLVVGAALALLGSCDGDSAPTTTSTTRTAKAAYITDADAICGALASEIRALKAPNSIEETALYLQQRIIIATRAHDALGQLVPPADAIDVHAALLDELERSNAKADEAVDAATAGDADALGPLLDDARTLGHAANAAADAYGFHECGTD